VMLYQWTVGLEFEGKYPRESHMLLFELIQCCY
jgi:hypothetical protein